MKRLHATANRLVTVLQPIRNSIGLLLIGLVGLYKAVVSPLLGSHCRFHPTCSTYAEQAIREYGPLGGSVRALTRIARCHPFCEGGYDPLH